MGPVNSVTSKFNQNPKSAQLLLKEQCADGVTADRVQLFKHYRKTRWHTRLQAMMAFQNRDKNMEDVAEEL